jgi:hypothetical protein
VIRRLLDFLRPGRREAAPAPSEPHSRNATDLVGLARCACHDDGCAPDCDTCHDWDDDDGPELRPAAAAVHVPAVRNADDQHAAPADLHRPAPIGGPR